MALLIDILFFVVLAYTYTRSIYNTLFIACRCGAIYIREYI